MAKNEMSDAEVQEKMMKQMIRKEMLKKLEDGVRKGDKRLATRISAMIAEDESEFLARKIV